MASPRAIMRCKKLKQMGSVAAALSHAFRERPTPNAHAQRTALNLHLTAQSVDEAMGNLRSKLPEKHRSDAVRAVEYVMSASPDWWKTATPQAQREFFDKARHWLREKYGKDAIVAEVVHLDESTPHLSAFVVPLKDGKLNAKAFIGSRALLRQDQTTFAQAVQHLGLERGVEGSKATHQSLKTYYAAVADGPQLVAQEVAKALETASDGLRARQKALDTRERRLQALEAHNALREAHIESEQRKLLVRHDELDAWQRQVGDLMAAYGVQVPEKPRRKDLEQGHDFSR